MERLTGVIRRLLFLSILLVVISGCVTVRSPLDGKYESQAQRNFGSEKVSVLFIFRHLKHTVGYDAIPKLGKAGIDFANIFNDARSELSNIGSFATFTDYASDVGKKERRAQRDSLIAESDYVLKIRIKRENSFPKQFLGILLSTVTLTLFPVPYYWSYTVNVDVYDPSSILVKSYQRESALTKWVQAFLIIFQPFYSETRVKEELYLESLHDIFKEIETEQILVK